MLVHEIDYGFPLLHQETTSSRDCGLIDPMQLSDFECIALEWQELDAFDYLIDTSRGGQVDLDGKNLRIDRYKENDNVIRSIIEEVSLNEDGTKWLQTYNLITNENGHTYFEKHPSYLDADGMIWEPEVGSQVVIPGTHTDTVLHYRVAYGATPLLVAA